MKLETIFIVSLIAYLLICVLVAMIRGSRKAFFRLLTVALSAVLAFVAVMMFKNMLGQEEMTARVNTLLANAGMQQILDIAASSPLLEEIILKTAGGIAAPILFFILFIVFSVVTYLLYFLITLILGFFFKKENAGSFSGAVGSIFGLLQGVIVAAALVLTIICYTDIVPEIAPKLENTASLNESQRESVVGMKNTVAEANETTVVTVFKKAGLEGLSHSLTAFSVQYGEESISVDMSDEIPAISELVFTFMDLSATKMAEYGEAEAVLIQRLGDNFTSSKVLSLAGAELLHNATESWKKGEPFAGIAKPSLGEDMDPLLTKLIVIFNESTKSQQNFSEDIKTTANLAAVFAKSGLLKAAGNLAEDQSALFNCLSKDGVISDITVTLNQSPRMGALVPEITNLGLKTLANSLGIADNTLEIYTDTLTSIAAHIKNTEAEPDPEKRIEALKPLLKTEFENIGVEIEPEYIDILASALIEDFGDIEGEINPEFIEEFFELYSNSLNNGTTETVGESASVLPLGDITEERTYTFPKYADSTLFLTTGAAKAAEKSLEIISLAAPDRLEAFKASSKLIADMRSGETATINRATIESFLVSPDCVITNPEAEAKALEAIVKEVVSIMDALKTPENNGMETIKNFSAGLGGALDNLSTTEMYGSDKTFMLFTAILQSETLRDTTSITVPETIRLTDKHRENADKVTFGSLMNVLTSTVDVITSMQNNKVTTETIEELVGNITPETAEIIKEVITVDRMEDMGIPKDKAEASTTLMGDLFDNLGKIEDPDAYAAEAKAVENIISIGIAAKDKLTTPPAEGAPATPPKNLFSSEEEGGEEGSLGCSADEMVNNIMSSTAVCDTVLSTVKDKENTDPFGVSANLTEEDEAAIKSACDNYVAANADKSPEEVEKMNETLDCITKLLGISGWSAPVAP